MCMIQAAAPLRAIALPLRPIMWAVEKLWSHHIEVSRTRIYARRVGDDQFVVYSMRLSSRADAVMVLPIPVAPGLAEDEALEFIDLSGYHDLFDDLDRPFQIVMGPTRSKGGFSAPELQMPKLKVHEVGAYDASFVPTIGDFTRLDERFRLPAHVWDALPQYEDFGFAVFKLGKGRNQQFHPMAFRFASREDTLFFPTVHVHDGTVHAQAHFEHELYFQLGTQNPVPLPQSHAVALNGAEHFAMQANESWGQAVNFDESAGVLDPSADIFKISLRGKLDNEDQRIAAA